MLLTKTKKKLSYKKWKTKYATLFINSNQITNKEITISDKENYQHIARSLRARAGENCY